MKILAPFILSLLPALLTGCGGGDTQTAEGGIGGTGVTAGRVSGFGSIYVNGVKFETANSDFIYEEEVAATAGDDSGIEVGMVIRVTGTHDGVTGVADIVEYAKLLEGSISSNDIASNETGTLTAMGQSISVDADTVYDDGGLATPLSTLPLGAIIEVSGFTDGNGNILATRITTKALGYSGETLEVKGFVSTLDPANNSFLLGTLSIDYSTLTLPDGIADGVYVEAKGSLLHDRLLATDVQIEGDGNLAVAEDGVEVELEGITTDILSTSPDSTLFILNGQQVLADAGTAYEPAADASSIIVEQPLKVSGTMDGSILVASKIELKTLAGDKQELEAIVEQVNTTENSVTLLGQTIRVTASTIYEDDLADEQLFNLNSLTPGVDYISVDLYVTADGALEASKLERESIESLPAEHAEIEGIVQSTDEIQQTISVVNVTIDISALAGFNPVVGERVEIAGLYDAATSILSAALGDTETTTDTDTDSDADSDADTNGD